MLADTERTIIWMNAALKSRIEQDRAVWTAWAGGRGAVANPSNIPARQQAGITRIAYEPRMDQYDMALNPNARP